MNMIRTTTTTTTTTDTCYAHKVAHNKYLPQFFVCNNNIIYHHHISLLSIVVILLFGDNIYMNILNRKRLHSSNNKKQQ